MKDELAKLVCVVYAVQTLTACELIHGVHCHTTGSSGCA